MPFMTWDEAEARIAVGDDREKVWDCVYLRPGEITSCWSGSRSGRSVPGCTRCSSSPHTPGYAGPKSCGVLPSDVDVAGEVVTIREKKRDKTKLTNRRVPLTPFLQEVLTGWLRTRGKGKILFCKTDGKPITPREAHNYFQRGCGSRNGACLRAGMFSGTASSAPWPAKGWTSGLSTTSWATRPRNSSAGIGTCSRT